MLQFVNFASSQGDLVQLRTAAERLRSSLRTMMVDHEPDRMYPGSYSTFRFTEVVNTEAHMETSPPRRATVQLFIQSIHFNPMDGSCTVFGILSFLHNAPMDIGTYPEHPFRLAFSAVNDVQPRGAFMWSDIPEEHEYALQNYSSIPWSPPAI